MIDKLQSLLGKNETLLLDARIHWIVFAPSIFYLFLALFVAVFFHPLVGFIIVLLTIYPIYTACIHYLMTHLVLTNHKVFSRAGFLTRDWTQMAIDKIENAYLEEPIVGRSLGYSTVVISGVGSGAIAVSYVVDGDEFIKRLETELEKSNGASQNL